MRRILIVLAFLICCVPAHAASPWSLGYYVNICCGPTTGYPAMSTIPLAQMTHISIVGGTVQSSGAITYSSGYSTAAPLMVSAANSAGVVPMLNIASGDFNDAVTNNLSTLISNIQSQITTYGFGGITMDYEESWNTTVVTNLLAGLRSHFSNSIRLVLYVNGPSTGPTTPTCAGSGTQITATQAAYLDDLEVDGYDLNSFGNSYQWSAPLYQPLPVTGNSYRSQWWNIQTFLACGIPASKISLALPFYGYSFSNSAPYAGGSYSATQQQYDQFYANYYTQCFQGGLQYDPVAQEHWCSVSGGWIEIYQQYETRLRWDYILGTGLHGASFWYLGSDITSGEVPFPSPLLQSFNLGNGTTDALSYAFFPTFDTNIQDYPSNVWVGDDMTKFQQQKAPAPISQVPSMRWYVANPAGQNEWVPIQVCEQASGSVTWNVTVSGFAVSGGPNSGATITTSSANTIIYGEYPYHIGAYTSDNDPWNTGQGYIFDALIPKVDPYFSQTTSYFPVTTTSGYNYCAWIDIYTGSALPGYYKGSVTVTHGGSDYSTMPIVIPVGNFSIPTTSSLNIYFAGDKTGGCYGYYGSLTSCGSYPPASGNAGTGQILTDQALAVLDVDHRITCQQCMLPWPNSGVSNNWSSVTPYWGTLFTGSGTTTGINPLMSGARMTSVGYTQSPQNPGNQANINNWTITFPSLYPKIANYLFDYICDEVVCTGSYIQSTAGVNAYNSSNGGGGSSPAMPVLATRGIADAIVGGYECNINILSPNIYTLYPYHGSNTRSSYNGYLAGSDCPNLTSNGGTKLITYNACNSFQCPNPGTPATGPPYYFGYSIDASPSRIRGMAWMPWYFGASGLLYYEQWYCMYNTNCGDYGTTTNCGTISPWTCRYYSGVQGDGNLVYPCDFTHCGTGSSGSWTPFPTPSFEMQLIREGLQDAELLNNLNTAGYTTYANQVMNTFLQSNWTFSEQSTDLSNANYFLAYRLHELGPTPPGGGTGTTVTPGAAIRLNVTIK